MNNASHPLLFHGAAASRSRTNSGPGQSRSSTRQPSQGLGFRWDGKRGWLLWEIEAGCQFGDFNRVDFPPLICDADALYNAAGVPIRVDNTGAAGDDDGQELDFTVTYLLKPRRDLLLGYSHFFSGLFIRNSGGVTGEDFY